MKYRDLVRRIEDDGWQFDRQKGSHKHYRHPNKPGTVTVPSGGRMNSDVPPVILQSVLRQAGLLGPR